MAKIYMVRHQAHGLLWQFPFESSPTNEQQAVLADYCARLHGENHPKTGEAYWSSVAEIELLGPEDAPQALVPVGGATESGAAMSVNTVSAVGHVSNPQEGS